MEIQTSILQQGQVRTGVLLGSVAGNEFLKASMRMCSILLFSYSKMVFLAVRPPSAADLFGVS